MGIVMVAADINDDLDEACNQDGYVLFRWNDTWVCGQIKAENIYNNVSVTIYNGSLQSNFDFMGYNGTNMSWLNVSTVNATKYYGDGSSLTGLSSGNVTWNQSHADTLYAAIGAGGDNATWNQSHADGLYSPVWTLSAGDVNYTSGETVVSHLNVKDTKPTFFSTIKSNELDSASGLVIKGSYAFVASYNNDSLTIIDINDPNNLTIVGHVSDSTNMNEARGVAVVGGYAYVTANEKLAVVDVSDVRNPEVVGSVSDTAATDAAGIYVTGKYAYVAGYTDWKLEIYDISSHTSPVLTNSVADSDLDYAIDVYVQDDVAIVGTRYGIVTMDVSDPFVDTKLDYVSSGESTCRRMTVEDGFAYLMCNGKIAAFDIRDPADTKLAKKLTDGAVTSAEDAYISNEVMYVTAPGDNAVVLYNVSDPYRFAYIGTLQDDDYMPNPTAIKVAGDKIYVLDSVNDSMNVLQMQGMKVSSIRAGDIQSDNSRVVSDLNVGNNIYAGTGVHVGLGGIFTDGGLTVKGTAGSMDIDVALSFIDSATNATALDGIGGLYVQGDYGYFTRGSVPGGFGILDMSSLDNITVISYTESDTYFDSPNNPVAVDEYVFVNSYDDDQVTVVDVRNKSNPTVVDTLKDSGELNGAYYSMVSGNVLYVVGLLGNGLSAIDITDPTNISFLDQGDYMFVPCYDDSSMTSIDISDPTNLRVVQELTDAASLSTGFEIKVSGRYAYHSGRYGGELTVVDISDPSDMTVEYVYSDPSSNYNWKNIYGDYMSYYDANGNDLFVMDISDPLAWNILRTFDMDNLGGNYIDGKVMYQLHGTGDEIRMYDMGGLDTPVLTTGNFRADYGRVERSLNIGGDLFVGDNIIAESLNAFGNLNMNGTAYINTAVGIGDKSPAYPLVVNSNTDGISIWASGNMSATGYNTRTSVYDKSKGDALNYVKDADDYLDWKNDIKHSEFYGYTTIEVVDYDRPYYVNKRQVIDEKCEIELDVGVDRCWNEVVTEYDEITYPYNKTVEQVSITDEIDMLRQALYELKNKVTYLEENCVMK